VLSQGDLHSQDLDGMVHSKRVLALVEWSLVLQAMVRSAEMLRMERVMSTVRCIFTSKVEIHGPAGPTVRGGKDCMTTDVTVKLGGPMGLRVHILALAHPGGFLQMMPGEF
jgi:hypothetical protein